MLVGRTSRSARVLQDPLFRPTWTSEAGVGSDRFVAIQLTSMQAQEIPVERWSDFEAKIRSLAPIPENNSRPWLFRGLGNSCWDLKTTLERSYPAERSLFSYYRKVLVAKPALETFSGRRWDLLMNPFMFEECVNKAVGNAFTPDQIFGQPGGPPEVYEYFVYLRHHGFPSPLLDWTTSPYVAAFFAFDDVVPESTDRVCVYAVLPRAGGSSDSSRSFTFVGPHMRTHERHYLQQCWYSICMGLDLSTTNWMFGPQEPAMVADNLGPVYKPPLKFTIPAKERGPALEHLDLMNINRFSLFRSEDSLVHTVARRECGYS
jgi:hypothetical protein